MLSALRAVNSQQRSRAAQYHSVVVVSAAGRRGDGGIMRALASMAGTTAIVAALLASTTRALDNGLGVRSPMGWNSWNHFGCNINESLVLEIGDFLVSSGMRQAGYNHVNLDDVSITLVL